MTSRPGLTWTSTLGAFAFVSLTIAVQLHLTTGLDLAIARSAPSLWNAPLDAWAVGMAVAFSSEIVVLVGCVVAFTLWRVGAGWWSLAALAFVPLAFIELTMKLTVDQVPLSSEFQRSFSYPLARLTLPASFPSGHAMRIGFVCLFAAVIAAHRWPAHRRVVMAIGLAAASIGALSRIYLGVHLTSDIVGGLLMGGTTAYVLGRIVVERFAWAGNRR